MVIVELAGSAVGLRELLRSPVREMARVITISDGGPGVRGGAGWQDLVFRVCASVDGREIDEVVRVSMPVTVDESLCAELDGLEVAGLEALFGDSNPVLAVDGALAANKDIMRAVLGVIRRNPARIIVCGERAAVDAPEVTVLQVRPALMAHIARRALAMLVPDGENVHAQALSMAEVLGLGGRAIAVGDRLPVHDLAELAALPAGLSGLPGMPCYEDVWRRVVAVLPRSVTPEAPARPCIALVTPMFPQKGGPPHSSLDLALALAETADVEVWTDSDMLPAHRARVSAVFRLDEAFDPQRYHGIVYVLGNHPMYARIFDMMREHGGALVLHDAHMLDFLNYRYGSRRLGTFLAKEYGKPLDASVPERIIGDLAGYGRPFLNEIVRHANPTIVHSPTSATVLRDLYGTEAHYFPVAMPYPFPKADLTAQARLQAKLALGISPSRPCIASFGEVHMMKGAKQCLFAMKELLDWGIDFQFLFVGPVDPELADELHARIEQYGLQDHIAIRGGVSEADYIQHLKAVDIVLQIRQVPFGQVSGALLDAVSAGMHGVASENLACSIEAPAFIRRVNDKASPMIYAEQLAEMIAARSYEDRPGPGWDDFTTKHDFGRYARNLLTLLLGKGREGA